jgi:ectoine hydroxylase-related dioxygenase (phytanoyl-CoA dioxygenase family)
MQWQTLMDSGFSRAVEQDGYAIIPGCINARTVDSLLAELEDGSIGGAVSRRAGRAFGIRNLLNVLPSVRTLAVSSTLMSLVEPVLGSGTRVVRGLYFDKHKDANWKVAWHQDLTIAVRKRIEVEGFGPWSLKAGICHVQPPLSVLEEMLALRVHLDDTDETNGALRVIPGSHKHGRLLSTNIRDFQENSLAVTCPVNAGGVMLMRPLLLHASSAAIYPRRRRVLHIEYSASELPGEMAWHDVPFD